MDFEEGLGERDPGPLVYQEVKVFNTEPSLICVYDNTQLRFVTFEVYGLDTQSMLKLQYEYAAFDNLFRFNAELMNPNRKEGRFHWIIERLTITQGSAGSLADRKLKLGEKPTEEVGQLPIYETVRKIPTGRMDLKERQRLREQMDILDIRRAENIARKRAATKERILAHIFFLKEDMIRRKQEQAERMEAERQLRFKRKEDEERKEEEALKVLETKSRLRRKAIDLVRNRNHEQEEFELQELRMRWKTSDEEKERIMKHAFDRREKMKKEAREKAEALRTKKRDSQNKRLIVFKNKADAQKERAQKWLAGIFESKTLQERAMKMRAENKQDAVREWDSWRIPLFKAQIERMHERGCAREAEAEAVQAYHDKRSVPKKQNLKASKTKQQSKETPDEGEANEATKEKKSKKGSKEGEKKEKKSDDKEKKAEKEEKPEEPKKDDAKEMGKMLDSLEGKMRAKMEEERRRLRMDKVRDGTIGKMATERNKKELKHLSAVREAKRKADEEEARLFAERIIVMREKDAEQKSAVERKKAERERLGRARESNILAKEKKWLMSITAGGA